MAQQNFRMPSLSENEQVLLESCMDEIRNVVGDSVSEKQLVETIMNHKFDCTKALDAILNSSSEKPTTTKSSQNTVPMETGNSRAIYHYILPIVRYYSPCYRCVWVISLLAFFFFFIFSWFIFIFGPLP